MQGSDAVRLMTDGRVLQDAVQLYEVLRPKKAKPEERQEIVNQIMKKVCIPFPACGTTSSPLVSGPRQGAGARWPPHRLADHPVLRQVRLRGAALSHHGRGAMMLRTAERALKDREPPSQVRAAMVELSKSKHGHHLVQKLIAVSKKDEVPGEDPRNMQINLHPNNASSRRDPSRHTPSSGLVAQFKGHVAELLRHPRGADVLVDLYDVASTTQRNAMCSEFYGKEYVLFDGVGKQAACLPGLKVLLEGVATAKKRSVFQFMTRALQPIMEKAILHPPIVHR